mmetsp:Transcript_165559/g.293246  ORF Transcript_165559/g.293246 Transcript_165559/m.293246 type:complete len:304 (-) Transcript_165559:30-941(-)
MAGKGEDNERKEFECSICLELLCEPQQLPCSHVFCRKCIAGCLQRDRHCALCRSSIPPDFNPTSEPVYKALEERITRQCTVEYTQRLEEVAMAAAHLVRIRISNSYSLLSIVPRMKHQWTLQVGLEAQPDSCLPHGAALPDLIKEVRFGLKPAFRILSYGTQSAEEESVPATGYLDVKEAPFQVTATSHVAADVPIVVIWQDWLAQPPLRLNHEMNVTHDGGSWDYGVDLRSAFGVAEQEPRQNGTMSETSSDLESEEQMPGLRVSRPGLFHSAWREACRRLHLPTRAARANAVQVAPCCHAD